MDPAFNPEYEYKTGETMMNTNTKKRMRKTAIAGALSIALLGAQLPGMAVATEST